MSTIRIPTVSNGGSIHVCAQTVPNRGNEKLTTILNVEEVREEGSFMIVTGDLVIDDENTVNTEVAFLTENIQSITTEDA